MATAISLVLAIFSFVGGFSGIEFLKRKKGW